MSMSDESRSRESGGMRNASQPQSGPGSRNSSPRPGLGGGAPTGLSSAMFGGAGARMPAYKPVTRAAEQPAPASARNFKPEDPFGAGALDSDPFASDPYNTDPFGLGLLDNDSPFSSSSQSAKREETRSFAGRAPEAYEAPNYIGDGNTADDDAGFEYDEPSEPEPLYYGAGATNHQPNYDASANDYYGKAPQEPDDYLDETLTLGNEQNGSEDAYLTLSGEQDDDAYGDDAYRNGRDVYANSADLDEPFELSEPAYQASYQDGYRPTSEDEIDQYIARAQRESDDRQAAAPAAAAPRSRSGRGAVQAFDAGYDQHQRPEIPLGGFSASRAKAPQRRGIEEMSDDEADFEAGDAPEGKRKFRLNRAMVMVTSALVGAVVLGGALAYAYRAGNIDVAGETPVIAADDSPVKVAAEDGGVQPAGGNKLIYDRLGGEPEQAGGEQIVPREENVALGNIPAEQQAAPAPDAMNIQGGLVEPALPGASEGVTPMPGAENDPPAQAEADPNGPRRVATYVVRPDGTVVQPEPEAAPAEQNVAAIPGSPAAAPQEPAQAAIAPSAGGAGQFVVQVGARKSQSEALAAFADLQQKHPQLLSGYRPMVQKAELGEKGTWYRLRVGPMAQKTAAAKLCDDLKGQGLPSCLVMNE